MDFRIWNMKRRIFLLMLLGILLIGFVSANYCCEKNVDGAWCQQEEDEDRCDSGYKTSQTGCESTSYCKLGTCVDLSEGTCSPNSPQLNCDGTWIDEDIDEIPQCQEACCVLGTQSFLDTLIGCKKESGDVGLETIFEEEVTNEVECKLLSATNEVGACVFGKGVGYTCQLLTEKECADLREIKNNVSFHEGFLCSATELNTDCYPTKNTICKDEKVYFTDNCNNLANIYDADRYEEEYYWTKIIDADEVECDDGKGNKDSKKCGVCDVFDSTTCGTGDINPEYGEYYCKSMDCKYNGETYQHGDRWCAWKEDGNYGAVENLPGSAHFVLECNDGEAKFFEECGEWRNLICMDSVVAGRPNAGCIANQWDDCIAQNNSKDCLNEDKRDCLWVEDKFGLKGERTPVKCVPKYAPAINFWGEGSSGSGATCSVANMQVKVTYVKGLTTEFGWECDENCWATESDWLNKMNKICNAVGDCGSSVNYIGKEGWYEAKDLRSKT